MFVFFQIYLLIDDKHLKRKKNKATSTPVSICSNVSSQNTTGVVYENNKLIGMGTKLHHYGFFIQFQKQQSSS